MNVIPVIDLLNDEVVHAKQGKRAEYQPIVSQLTHSSKPLDIVAALLDFYPFKSLYIADLNAIQQDKSQENHIETIAAILTQYPDLDICLDCGINTTLGLKQWANLTVNPILGTENFANINDYLTIQQVLVNNNQSFFLSLDFMPNGFKGDAQFLTTQATWPNDVIVMTLNQVGSALGPDLAMLKAIQQDGPAKLYAAGGIRDIDDLIVLKENAIHGALIATAIHQKTISPQQLQSLETKKA